MARMKHLVMTLCAVGMALAVAPALAETQDPPAPVMLGAARPMTSAEAASRMTGTWKLNEELSPLPRAGSSPAAGAVPSRGGRGGGGSGGSGGGRPAGVLTQNQLQQLRLRAIYRELTVRPQQLKITATLAQARFVDEDEMERVVELNGKKGQLDLGTTVLDARSRWDAAALTIELEAGSQLKLTEVFELSPTGRQLLVTLKTGDGTNPRRGQTQSYVQRVYDRIE